MERVLELLSRFLDVFFNAVGAVVNGAIGLVEWPAGVMGVPAEILAAALLCLLLLAAWRAMGGFFT
jgi:hypothetical protein